MIYNRQKLLLRAIKEINLKGDFKTYLVKTMFLLRQNFDYEKVGYNFFPHHYGPFSNVIYEDLNHLHAENLLKKDKLELTEEGKTLLEKTEFDSEVVSKLADITLQFSSLKQIRSFVYDNYKDTTVKSNDARTTINIENKGICSVGYEGKTIDSFLNDLILNNVTMLVDVRKNAFSMKPAFRKKNLQNYLEKSNISYVHIPELGIDSEKRQELNTDSDYKALFKEYEKELLTKKDKIQEVIKLSKNNRIALMCFEADHNHCHRGTLSNNLGANVTHL